MNARISVRPRFSARWLPLIAVGLLNGCTATIPSEALRLPESTLDIRSIQTRTFEAPSETEILAATIATLQDNGVQDARVDLGILGNDVNSAVSLAFSDSEGGSNYLTSTISATVDAGVEVGGNDLNGYGAVQLDFSLTGDPLPTLNEVLNALVIDGEVAFDDDLAQDPVPH